MAGTEAALVLVHGAWHGAWCWERVERALAANGIADVVTPTLTGIGERRGELAPTVGLRTHVHDVVAVLERVDRPVVLVGHSYAGLVVREAADRCPDAVAHLVLVDGWVGDDGDSLVDIAPAWMVDVITRAAADSGDGWKIPPPPPALVGVDDPVDADWLQARLTEQPLATFTDSTRLTGVVDRVPTSAVTAEPSALPFGQLADDAGWPARRLPGGHDLMVTSPGPLAAALAEALGAVATA
jgi:pimeloyl-ACP methyl ester carboxylesterase